MSHLEYGFSWRSEIRSILRRMGSVITALFEVLGEAREDAERESKHIAYHLPWVKAGRTVERWEDGETAPPGLKIDSVVAAYATECDITVEDAWDRALDKAFPDRINAALDAAAKGAADAARRAGKSLEAQERSGKAPARKPKTATRKRSRK